MKSTFSASSMHELLIIVRYNFLSHIGAIHFRLSYFLNADGFYTIYQPDQQMLSQPSTILPGLDVIPSSQILHLHYHHFYQVSISARISATVCSASLAPRITANAPRLFLTRQRVRISQKIIPRPTLTEYIYRYRAFARRIFHIIEMRVLNKGAIECVLVKSSLK